MSRTVADQLIEALEDLGVTHVFGVVGDALNPVTDAIRRSDTVRWVGCRHEEVAAYAAGAQAQLTGRLGVCMGTVGPGAVHLLGGLYDAQKSHAPVLAVAGQVPTSEIGSDFFQEVRNDKAFADASGFEQTITSAAQMPRVLEQAVQVAMTRPGVSVLTLPADIGSEAASDDRAKPFWAEPPTRPSSDELLRAVELIADATKVTLLVGRGARGARAEVLELADRLGAPMVVALQGKQGFDHDNTFAVGQSGLLGNPAAQQALDDADLLVMIGTDFPYREFLPAATTTIQIDRAAAHIGRRTSVDLGLVGHAKPTVAGLLELLPARREERGHLNSAAKHYEQWNAQQAKPADPEFEQTLRGRTLSKADNRSGRIRPEAVASAVARHAARDAIFTTDTGMSTVWLARFVRLTEDQRLLGSFNYGSMANAMPQAIGAQLLDRERQVIAFCGDGGLTMLLGDLLTAVDQELPLTLIVFNNERLGMVKLEQEEAGLPEFGTTLSGVDHAAIASACGFAARRVEAASDLDEAIAWALANPGPTLLDVLTNPDEVALPPKPSLAQGLGFVRAKAKELLRSADETQK